MLNFKWFWILFNFIRFNLAQFQDNIFCLSLQLGHDIIWNQKRFVDKHFAEPKHYHIQLICLFPLLYDLFSWRAQLRLQHGYNKHDFCQMRFLKHPEVLEELELKLPVNFIAHRRVQKLHEVIQLRANLSNFRLLIDVAFDPVAQVVRHFAIYKRKVYILQLLIQLNLLVVHLWHLSGDRTHYKCFQKSSKEDDSNAKEKVFACLWIYVVTNNEENSVVAGYDVLFLNSFFVELSYSSWHINWRNPVIVCPWTFSLLFWKIVVGLREEKEHHACHPVHHKHHGHNHVDHPDFGALHRVELHVRHQFTQPK